MKHCIYCGAEMPDEAKFCGKCGTAFAVEQKEQNCELQSAQQQSTIIIQTQTNSIGIVGFVFALIGLFIGYIPFVGWIIVLVGAICSSKGRNKEPKGLAIAGSIISVINIIIMIFSWFLYESIMRHLSNLF